MCNDHFPGSSTCDAAGPTSWCVALFSLSFPPPRSTDDRPRLQCSRRQRRDAVPEQRALVSSSSSSSSGFFGRTRSQPHLLLQRDGRHVLEWDVRQRRCVLPLLVLERAVADSSLSQEPARASPARLSAISSRRATGRAPSRASATASCTSAAASTSARSALFEMVRARSPLLCRRPDLLLLTLESPPPAGSTCRACPAVGDRCDLVTAQRWCVVVSSSSSSSPRALTPFSSCSGLLLDITTSTCVASCRLLADKVNSATYESGASVPFSSRSVPPWLILSDPARSWHVQVVRRPRGPALQRRRCAAVSGAARCRDRRRKVHHGAAVHRRLAAVVPSIRARLVGYRRPVRDVPAVSLVRLPQPRQDWLRLLSRTPCLPPASSALPLLLSLPLSLFVVLKVLSRLQSAPCESSVAQQYRDMVAARGQEPFARRSARAWPLGQRSCRFVGVAQRKSVARCRPGLSNCARAPRSWH